MIYVLQGLISPSESEGTYQTSLLAYNDRTEAELALIDLNEILNLYRASAMDLKNDHENHVKMQKVTYKTLCDFLNLDSLSWLTYYDIPALDFDLDEVVIR